MQPQCTAAVVRAKQLPCCSVLLCKTGSQQPCATAITPQEFCSSYRCAVMQQQGTAAVVRAKQLPCCSVLICKTGSHQPCAAAIRPMEVCSSYRCAVMQQQCTAAVVNLYEEEICIGVFAVIQACGECILQQCCGACSDPTPVHRNTVQAKMQSPLLSAAL